MALDDKRNDLEDNLKEDDTVNDILNRCLTSTSETICVGSEASTELYRQGTQLNRIRKRVSEIRRHNNFAVRIVKRMSSWVPFLHSTPIPPSSPEFNNVQIDTTLSGIEYAAYPDSSVSDTSDTSLDEDGKFDMLSSHLDTLKNMATNIHTELDRQTDVIENIGDEVENEDRKLGMINRMINRLL